MTSERPGSDTDPIDHGDRPGPVLHLVPLPPPPLPRFEIEHLYFELVYEPLIGPSAFVVARNLSRRLQTAGGRATVYPVELAREAGLRASRTEPLGRNAPLVKTLKRLSRFEIVRFNGGEIGVFRAVAPVPERWRDRLPPSALAEHDRLIATRHS